MGFIYGLCLETDSTIRYVGLTRKSLEFRFQQHKVNASANILDYPVYRWMRKHENEVKIVTLEVPEEDAALEEAERRWIAELREQNNNLLNCTDGGDGAKGYVFTDEVKQKMSEAKIGYTPWIAGKKHSEETRAKISAAVRKARKEKPLPPVSEETRRKQSKIAKKRGNNGVKRKSLILTPEKIDTIFSMRKEGASGTAIGKIIGVSGGFITSIISGRYVPNMTIEHRKDLEEHLSKQEPMMHFNSKISLAQVQQFKELYETNMYNQRELSEIMGIGVGSIGNLCRLYKIGKL